MRILTPAAAEASSLDSTPVDVTVHDVRFSQIWSGIDKLLLESQPTKSSPPRNLIECVKIIIFGLKIHAPKSF